MRDRGQKCVTPIWGYVLVIAMSVAFVAVKIKTMAAYPTDIGPQEAEYLCNTAGGCGYGFAPAGAVVVVVLAGIAVATYVHYTRSREAGI